MLTWIHEIDWRVLDWIYKHTRTRLGNVVMPLLSISGNFGFIWFLTAAAFYFLKRSQDAAEAIFFALVISSFLGSIVLKNLVRRPRPFNTKEGYDTIIQHPVDLSFPSGHTFTSFAAASAVCFYLPFWGALSLLFAGCIAFSRLYLCVHFLSDVLTSAVLGIGTGIAVHYLVNMNLF